MSDASAPVVRTGLHLALQRATLLFALVLTCIPPMVLHENGRAMLEAGQRAELRSITAAVGEMAARNPGLWTFEVPRIEHLVTKHSGSDVPSLRIIVDSQGEVVVAVGSQPAWPVLRHEAPILAHGEVVGTAAIMVSRLALLRETAGIALLSFLLAGLGYLVLGRIPLKVLDRTIRQVSHLATHDMLTGLPNRARFMDRLEIALATSRRDPNLEVALLCLDLDRFKEVNDTLGHSMGDELLRRVVVKLRAELRETDTLARLGGDEFAIVLFQEAGGQTAEVIAQRLIRSLEEPVDLDSHLARIGLSIGIAIARGRDASEPETLLSDADTALYTAKREGRGTFRFFREDMNIALRERRAMEADLRTALAEKQFELDYQPQVDLATGRIIGVEALMRWNHPTRGRVPPDSFIPLAEEIGLLPTIGAWVLNEACEHATRWPAVTIAVNVSAHQIHAGGFETLVARALEQTGLPASRLEIEITEGVLLSQTEATIATLEQIRALGVSIAMDDFGTGYSSLGYLQRFRFDKLKIDRSFIAGLATDPSAAAIVDAVLGITRALGVRANAEGVETPEQARLLVERGCSEAQGWLFSRPVPAAQIDTLLAQRVTEPAL